MEQWLHTAVVRKVEPSIPEAHKDTGLVGWAKTSANRCIWCGLPCATVQITRIIVTSISSCWYGWIQGWRLFFPSHISFTSFLWLVAVHLQFLFSCKKTDLLFFLNELQTNTKILNWSKSPLYLCKKRWHVSFSCDYNHGYLMVEETSFLYPEYVALSCWSVRG